MADQQTIAAYLAKAEESLASAESDFAAGRYNSCANRCYYACFQAALAALLGAGIGPRGRSGQWKHDYVRAAFEGLLIERRKRYPSRLRGVLSRTQEMRDTADYAPEPVSRKEAGRVLRPSREFVEAIRQAGDEGQ